MEPFWEKEYLNNSEFVFGEPSTEVKLYSEFLPTHSRILDLGCGDGRNALYLASQGFFVDCVDVSKNAIDKINLLIKKPNIKINTVLCDVKSFEYTCDYDMIIAHGLLQFIDKKHQSVVIKDMKQHTKKNGYNIISVFTDELPIPDDLKDIMVGIFKEEEIKEYYSDWDIELFESKKFHDEHEYGIKHYHASNKIVAKKHIK